MIRPLVELTDGAPETLEVSATDAAAEARRPVRVQHSLFIVVEYQ
jgi:hypothetical protein